MKTILLIAFVIIASVGILAQSQAISISGGYVFANVEDVETDAKGWRINGSYEFINKEGKISHGVTFGYISTSAEYTKISGQSTSYEFKSMPLYYSPKFMFGGETSKGFVKGAIGAQFSSMSREGSLGNIDANDAGLFGGFSFGFMQALGEKAFINAEYEWNYLSNSYYRDGFVNSIMIGLGLKL